MDLQDRPTVVGLHGRHVVADAGAIRRPDLDQPGAAGSHHVREAVGASDLDQLTA